MEILECIVDPMLPAQASRFSVLVYVFDTTCSMLLIVGRDAYLVMVARGGVD